MKRFVLIGFSVAVLFGVGSASADQWVNGYTKKDGTYVQGHYRTNPDSYRYNNRGSQSWGGFRRDEFSSGLGATNRRNPSWGWRDNDNDGLINSYDPRPESKRNW